MSKQHTPGPWAVGYSSPTDEDNCCLAVWRKADLDYGFGSVVCKISPMKQMDDTDHANANLIAAAPDLLDALKELLNEEIMKDDLLSRIAINKAKSVIKKATIQ